MARKKDIETLSEEQKAQQEEIRRQQQEAEQLEPATVVAEQTKPEPAPAPVSLGQQMLENDREASLNPEQPLPAPAPLGAATVDPVVATTAAASRNDQRSFADYVLGMRQELDQAQREANQEVKADLNAARWTGLTELASSIANMIGVGAGNAVSQQITPQSQNWMAKADRDMKANRSRIDNLRQRLRENELKMNQIRTQGSLAVAKAGLEAEQQKWLTAYRKAQVEYEQARTEAAKQKAQQDAKKAEAEYNAILALANQREASARGNLIRAGATAQNAASRQSSVENQNANRDARTGSQNMVDQSRAAANWSRASGQNIPLPPGWSVQTPQTQAPSGNLPPAPSANNTTPSSLPVPPSRRR